MGGGWRGCFWDLARFHVFDFRYVEVPGTRGVPLAIRCNVVGSFTARVHVGSSV